jgi:hypothetical protein
MDIEEAYFQGVTPVKVDEKGDIINEAPIEDKKEEVKQDIIEQPVVEAQKSSLKEENAEVKTPEAIKEEIPEASVVKEEVPEVQSDEDFAKFVSTRLGKEISSERLKSLIEDPKSPFTNDTIKEINEYVGKGGDLKDYMEFKMTDFSGMSDLEIVSKQMQREHPNLTRAQVTRKINRDFKLDEDKFDEEEIEDGKIDLTIEAKRSREYFANLTSQYSAPLQTKKEEAVATPDFSNEEIEKFQTDMTNSVNNLKVIEVDDFKFEVNDDLRGKVSKAPTEIGDMFATGDSFDFNKYNQLRAIATHGIENFVKAVIKHGESKALAGLKDKRNNVQLEPEAHNPTQTTDNKQSLQNIANLYNEKGNSMKPNF